MLHATTTGGLGGSDARAPRGRALVICALVSGFVLSAASAAPAAGCIAESSGPAGAVPAEGALRQAAMSVVDEINQERTGRLLPRLHVSSRLRRAGEHYARAMVRRGFFSHLTPGGRDITARVQGDGYLRGAAAWALGETLAWGTGDCSTPAAIVTAWMDSQAHRRVLLSRRYRDVGVGVALGTPFAPSRVDAATYAAELGFVAP